MHLGLVKSHNTGSDAGVFFLLLKQFSNQHKPHALRILQKLPLHAPIQFNSAQLSSTLVCPGYMLYCNHIAAVTSSPFTVQYRAYSSLRLSCALQAAA